MVFQPAVGFDGAAGTGGLLTALGPGLDSMIWPRTGLGYRVGLELGTGTGKDQERIDC